MGTKELAEELFTYQYPIIGAKVDYLISPSGLSRFFTDPTNWYKENIAKSEVGFQGNTSSVLGTICHFIYEIYANGQSWHYSKEVLNAAIDYWFTTYPNPDVNTEEIKNIYPDIAGTVIKEYLDKYKAKASVEQPIFYDLGNNIYVGGTLDRYEIDNHILCDFKTVSKKPSETEIPFSYFIQTLAYSYMLRNKGFDVDKIRIIYGIRPTKTIAARCQVVDHDITADDIQMIQDVLYLVRDTILAGVKHPELVYLLYKSMDLKLSKEYVWTKKATN